MAVRATMDNKRAGKNGVFLPEHNDHGKALAMDGLWFRWTMYDNEVTEDMPEWVVLDNPDFTGAEMLFYESELSDGLDAQNDAHIKGGHRNRCKTMEEYRTSKNTCPESTEYYLGDMKEHADPAILRAVVIDFACWRSERFPLVRPLNLAGHTEEGAPHMVDRHAWTAHDEDGNLIISQERALEEMGVERPDEARYQKDMAAARKIKDPKERRKKVSQINRFNNRKMTYTAECREKLFEIAKSYGVEVITEPRKPGKNSISQAQHILEDKKREIAEADQKIESKQSQLATLETDIAALEAKQEKMEDELDEARQDYKRLQQAQKTATSAVWALQQAQAHRNGGASLMASMGAVVASVAAESASRAAPERVASVRSPLASRLIAADEERWGTSPDSKPVEYAR